MLRRSDEGTVKQRCLQLQRLPAHRLCLRPRDRQPAAESAAKRIACMDVNMEGVSSVKIVNSDPITYK